MWEDILSIANMMNAPRLLAEDFNDIACADEKKGGASVCMRRCKKFQQQINSCNLLDLGSMGYKFT
jgi:hypothetical protein